MLHPYAMAMALGWGVWGAIYRNPFDAWVLSGPFAAAALSLWLYRKDVSRNVDRTNTKLGPSRHPRFQIVVLCAYIFAIALLIALAVVVIGYWPLRWLMTISN
jgi:hypothetical protein